MRPYNLHYICYLITILYSSILRGGYKNDAFYQFQQIFLNRFAPYPSTPLEASPKPTQRPPFKLVRRGNASSTDEPKEKPPRWRPPSQCPGHYVLRPGHNQRPGMATEILLVLGIGRTWTNGRKDTGQMAWSTFESLSIKSIPFHSPFSTSPLTPSPML